MTGHDPDRFGVVGLQARSANSALLLAHVSLVKNEPAKLLCAWQQNDNASVRRCPIVAYLLPPLICLRGKVSSHFCETLPCF